MSDIALAVEQTRTEGLLGASEAAAALGLDRYTSPLTVWKRLRGEHVDEERHPAVQEAAEWGQALEPVVRGRYALKTNRAIVVPEASRELDGWLRATPDGFVYLTGRLGVTVAESESGRDDDPAGLLQVKCRSAYRRDDFTGGVPAAEEIQMRVEMAVCDLPWNDCAVLIGGNSMLIHRIERDASLEDRILTDLRAFWALVQSGREPSPDHTAAWRAHVSEKMRPSKVELVADEETEQVARYCIEQHRKAAKAKDEADAAKNDLLLRLSAAGATRLALADGTKVTAYPVGAKPRWKEYALSLGGDAKVPDRFKGDGKSWSIRLPGGDDE